MAPVTSRASRLARVPTPHRSSFHPNRRVPPPPQQRQNWLEGGCPRFFPPSPDCTKVTHFGDFGNWQEHYDIYKGTSLALIGSKPCSKRKAEAACVLAN